MHEPFLRAALVQAKYGQGLCAPNPCVGAVAVQNGKIIAQAWHRGAGTAHAEQLLLAQLPPKLPEITLYITLEPCNHWGRTSPCVDAIVDYGIKKVVFAYKDPNPVVAKNNSFALLSQHQIEVIHYPLPEINEFYVSYSYWMQTHKPRITVKLAQTFDGKIGYASGNRALLSNVLCNQFTHEMRATADVLLTTANTIIADNPQMNVRLNDQEYAKPVAIIDRNLRINEHALIFTKAKYCHIYCQKKVNNTLLAHDKRRYYPINKKKGGLDLIEIIGHLGALGYHDVWVEAGSLLFNALHEQGLVHRTYLYLVPTLLGEKAIAAYQYERLFENPHTMSWHAMGNNMIVCVDWQGGACLQA